MSTKMMLKEAAQSLHQTLKDTLVEGSLAHISYYRRKPSRSTPHTNTETENVCSGRKNGFSHPSSLIHRSISLAPSLGASARPRPTPTVNPGLELRPRRVRCSVPANINNVRRCLHRSSYVKLILFLVAPFSSSTPVPPCSATLPFPHHEIQATLEKEVRARAHSHPAGVRLPFHSTGPSSSSSSWPWSSFHRSEYIHNEVALVRGHAQAGGSGAREDWHTVVNVFVLGLYFQFVFSHFLYNTIMMLGLHARLSSLHRASGFRFRFCVTVTLMVVVLVEL